MICCSLFVDTLLQLCVTELDGQPLWAGGYQFHLSTCGGLAPDDSTVVTNAPMHLNNKLYL